VRFDQSHPIMTSPGNVWEADHAYGQTTVGQTVHCTVHTADYTVSQKTREL